MSILRRQTPLKRKHQNSTRRRNELRAPSHYKWVGGFECCVANDECRGRIHRHHVRKGIPYVEQGGTGEKPHDKWCVPLCDGHHEECHRGHDTFEKKYGIDLKSVAERLWQQSPHRRKYEQ